MGHVSGHLLLPLLKLCRSLLQRLPLGTQLLIALAEILPKRSQLLVLESKFVLQLTLYTLKFT
jgi:hypothetical protein